MLLCVNELISSLTILCISPISIPNPNYGVKVTSGSPFSVKDCTSKRINVPCGHCSECIASRQSSLIQRVDLLSTKYHVFFFTLTYNNDSLRTITTSTGYEFAYADLSDFQKMMKRLRIHNSIPREFKYLLVSERGSVRSRPHFHGLLFLRKDAKDDDCVLLNLEHYLYNLFFNNWSRNIGSDKKPVYQKLFTYKETYRGGMCYRNFDFHRVRPWSSNDISSPAWYCIKYMLKPSDKEQRLQQALKLNLPEDEYNDVWKLIRSRHVFSKNFATDDEFISDIRKGIDLSLLEGSPFPKYIMSSGNTVPLSRVYKSKGKFYGLDDALAFKANSDNVHMIDNPVFGDESVDVNRSRVITQEAKFKRLASVPDKDYTLID